MNQGPRMLAGRYELIEVIGRGAMGQVWNARDRRLDRPVAVKVASERLALDAQMQARFGAEARAAARLNHPNVVTVYDSGEDDGIPFLVMELLPGRTLRDEIDEGPLPSDRARTVGVQVLAGLAASHRAGILHRDIKPGNVLLTEDGTARLADFGIAKSLDSGEATATGVVLGTTAYLAPERLTGHPATPQSDIYAVGALLYEALAGRKPFPAETPLATLQAIEHGRPPPLRHLRPDLDPALAAAVERALAKDPGQRYATASEMADALQSARDSRAEPVATTSITPTEPIQAVSTASPSTHAATGPTVELTTPAPSRAATRPVVDHPSPAAPWWHRRRTLTGVALLAALIVALAAALARPSPSPDDPAGTGPAPTSASVPESLDDALAELEDAVRS